MARFEITAPDGARYEVTAPEGATEQQALAHFQANWKPDVPIPEPKPDMRSGFEKAGDYAKGLTNAVTQGFTFNLGDEASGAGAYANQFLKGLLTGKGISGANELGVKGYQDVTGTQKAEREKFRDENPVSAVLGELLGGFSTAAPKAGAAALTQGAPATVGQAVKQGAIVGGTGGAVAGFGSGDGLGDSLEKGAIGGGVGATLGGAVPIIANVTSRFGGKVLDATGLRNPQAGADRQLLRAFERDQAAGGPGPTEVAGMLAANSSRSTARPEMIPDVAGENVQRLAASATQTPGAARQVAQTALTERTAGQSARISEDVARLVSPNADYHGTVQGLTQARTAAAAPKYEAAFGRDAWSPRVDEFLADPIAKDGLKRGLKIMRLEGVAEGKPVNWSQMGVEFNAAGDPVLKAKPNMRLLDAVKKGVDDILEGYRDTTTGRLVLDETGRAIEKFRKAYVGTLDDLNPLYAEARKAWSGPSQAMDALAMGRNIFRPDAEVSAKMVAAMSPSEKEMFAAGVARAISDKVDNTADGRNAVAGIFGKQAFRDKLRAAFPDEQSFAQFADLMRRETRMATAANQYGPRAGPATARNLADAADMQIDPPAGVLANLMTGNFGRAAIAGGEGIMRRAQGMNSSTADALAPTLFATAPKVQAKELARLLGVQQKGVMDTRQNRALARALLQGSGTAAGSQLD